MAPGLYRLRQGSKNTVKQISKRGLRTSACLQDEKPVMNRYSRTITQPKSQGASQVRHCFFYYYQDANNIV